MNDEIQQELSQLNINNYQHMLNGSVDMSHIYASKIPGAVNMKVVEDNRKLENEITEWHLNNQVKEIQKLYNQRYDELHQLMEVKDKRPPNIELASTIAYYLVLKEENIMKKELLDICQTEINGIQMEYIDQQEPLI